MGAERPGGDPARHIGGHRARRDEAGRSTPRQRIAALLDEGSFVETGALGKTPGDPDAIYSDGVVTGHGRINGRPVCIYAHDKTVYGGSVGVTFGKKVTEIMDMAIKIGCPVIGIQDSGGARIQEGVASLGGYADVFQRNVLASGVVPQLEALGERTAAMLAISLHATNDALRDVLVPLNKKYPLDQLMAAIRAYPGLSNARRVTFEYVMLKGVNDSPEEARALVRLIQGIPAKINLIPFNPWPGTDYGCSDWKTIERFAAILNKAGYASPIRTPRGRDILAACGQLKSESEKVRASALRRAEQTAA